MSPKYTCIWAEIVGHVFFRVAFLFHNIYTSTIINCDKTVALVALNGGIESSA
jgi:hypothetical protein